MDEILHLEKEFKSKIDQSDNLHKIEQVKTEAFGKNGKIGELFKKITTLQGEDRKREVLDHSGYKELMLALENKV